MTTMTVTRMARRAMGVKCEVTVVGNRGIPAVRDALAQVSVLESLWSRFDPSSDISRLNRAGGAPTWVADETVTLVRHMIAAHAATAGLFDPTLLPAQLLAGDRASLCDSRGDSTVIPSPVSHEIEAIEFVDDSVIRLPQGLLLDAGGIGKGLAADMIAQSVMDSGADGTCINLGGDMRCIGATPDPRGWTVSISSPDDWNESVTAVCVSDGAVATSSLGARSASNGAVTAHVFDPRTDGPSCRAFAGASVIAGTAAWAEAFTKYVLLGEPDTTFPMLDSMGVGCLALDRLGVPRANAAWEGFVL